MVNLKSFKKAEMTKFFLKFEKVTTTDRPHCLQTVTMKIKHYPGTRDYEF